MQLVVAKMILHKRSFWLLFLVLALAIASNVRCTEDKIVESLGGGEELYDDEFTDYDNYDEGEYGPSQPLEPQSTPGGYSPQPQQQEYQSTPPVYPQPPAQQEYQAPVPPPQPAYQPAFEPSPPQQPAYDSVRPSYQPPTLTYAVVQEIPAPTYQAPPQPTYQPPQPTYQPPQQVYQPVPVPQVSYQSQPSPQPTYQTASVPQASYPSQPSPQPAYQPAPAPQASYQPKSSPQPAYQPAPVKYQPEPTYQAPPTPEYQPPAVVYQAPVVQQPQVSYEAPKPVYQAPPAIPALNYSVPIEISHPLPQKQATNYAVVAPILVAPKQHLPIPVPVSVKYAPVVTYNRPQPTYNVTRPAYSSGVQQYSPADLMPFTSPYGYRGNHWTLQYYRASPYRTCPKYLQPPSYKDVEAAFVFAQSQLGQLRGVGIQYMNSTLPSFAARHQIFSFLSQQNARMDEEGLLLELVSQYLAERACLTKWDKQRYLPQLTRFLETRNFPATHSCSNYYNQAKGQQWRSKDCYANKYRTIDGFCNNPYHPYWGKSNVCHIRLLSPDYADGVSMPRNSYNSRFPLPNPRSISNTIHNDIPIEGPYNLMKMQWGQFINHDITNTALSSYDGLVDCCKQPQTRGCWPIYVPPSDPFYARLNVTCLNFIRSGVCPTCQLGPRQQLNKNTAFLDLSHVYGNSQEQANQLRSFRGGQLRYSTSRGSNEVLLPLATSQEQCMGVCFQAGDSRVNQHPALTALHTLLLRNHNILAQQLARRHPNWSDETLYQEARRINIAEYQMITYNEYLPIVFGPILSAYYKLTPQRSNYTYFEPKADPTTWNEYSTATCRFGHSQISSTFGLYSRIAGYGQKNIGQPTFRLKDWFMRPSLLSEGQMVPLMNGLMGHPSQAVDPWITNDVRNHLYQSHKEHSGGDLAATNIWRGRDHGIPGYVHYVEYCFNFKVRNWKDLATFIPPSTLSAMRKLYRMVDNVDLFTGGMAERHFPGADIGPTFACVNGIQYYHLKFGDRYYFEHANQAGSFSPLQLDEIRRSTLARLVCRTAHVQQVPQYAFLQPSLFNPLVNCNQLGDFDFNKF